MRNDSVNGSENFANELQEIAGCSKFASLGNSNYGGVKNKDMVLQGQQLMYPLYMIPPYMAPIPPVMKYMGPIYADYMAPYETN